MFQCTPKIINLAASSLVLPPALAHCGDLLDVEWKDGQDHLTPGTFLIEILFPTDKIGE